MSDDDVTLFGKLKNKLIDSKQKWAESGRLLTGKTVRALQEATLEIPRGDFLGRLAEAVKAPGKSGRWQVEADLDTVSRWRFGDHAA